MGALITAAVTVLFFALYWNRFAGLRSGNGSFQGGLALLHGVMPYRDFFTAGPPLNEVFSAAVLKVFGTKLIVIRGWGVFERVVLALLLYTWLAKLFRAKDAALASMVAIVVSAGDPSNALSSYGFEAIFFFLLSGFAAWQAVEPRRSLGSVAAWAAASGLCAALSLGTKQTLGVGATVGIPILAIVFALRERQPRRVFLFLAAFALGWSLVIGAIWLWLADIGAVHRFLEDAFRKGPSAKALHSSDFIIRAARAAWGIRYGCIAALLALAICWRALRGTGRADYSPENPLAWGWLTTLGVLPVIAGAGCAYAGWWPLRNFDTFAIYFGFLGSILLLLYYGWRLIRGELTERELRIGFLAGVCFGSALMVSLSWPASFDMVFPALGLMLAAALHGSNVRLRCATYAVCVLAIFALTCEKLNLPHGFHEWEAAPVRLANTESSLPELQGLKLPAATVRFIDGTAAIIRDHSTREDTIFVFPEFGIFYALTDRKTPTETDSHNIDVVNDEFARSEARRLLQSRPAVLVYYRTPEWSLRADEKIWRHGERSGQRDLIAAVEKLAGEYRLAASFHVPPNDGPVNVYVRDNPAASSR